MKIADVRAACGFAKTYSRKFHTTLLRVDTSDARLQEDWLDCAIVSPPGLVVTRESTASTLLFKTLANMCAGALVLRVTYFDELLELLEIPACFIANGCSIPFEARDSEAAPATLEEAVTSVTSVAVGQDGSWVVLLVANRAWVLNFPLAAQVMPSEPAAVLVERKVVLGGEQLVQVLTTLADTLLIATNTALHEFTSRGTYVRTLATQSYVHLALHGTMLAALRKESGSESTVDVLDVASGDLLHSFAAQSLRKADSDENPGAEVVLDAPSSSVWRFIGVCVFARGQHLGVLQYEYVPTEFGDLCVDGCVHVYTLAGAPVRSFYLDADFLQDLPSKFACTPENELIVLTTRRGRERATCIVFSEYGDVLAMSALEDNMLGFDNFPVLFVSDRVFYVSSCGNVTIHAVGKLA